MNNIRVACTALGKRIMAGRVSKDGLDFIGSPVDVTSDVLKAVIDMVGVNGTHNVTCDGSPVFEITIKDLKNLNMAGGKPYGNV